MGRVRETPAVSLESVSVSTCSAACQRAARVLFCRGTRITGITKNIHRWCTAAIFTGESKYIAKILYEQKGGAINKGGRI